MSGGYIMKKVTLNAKGFLGTVIGNEGSSFDVQKVFESMAKDFEKFLAVLCLFEKSQEMNHFGNIRLGKHNSLFLSPLIV
jgi:hypothetical protein